MPAVNTARRHAQHIQVLPDGKWLTMAFLLESLMLAYVPTRIEGKGPFVLVGGQGDKRQVALAQDL